MFSKAKAVLATAIKKQIAQIQAPFELIRQQQTYQHYRGVMTLDPELLASAFRQADYGYITRQAQLFELIEERDPHIYGELSKRRRSVVGLDWDLYPRDDASQAEIARTGELKSMIAGINNIEDSFYDLTDAIGKGFSALEIYWRTGREWVPEQLLWVPQRLFELSRDSNELLLLVNGQREPLRPDGWIVHEHRARSGYIESAALFRVLAWTYVYKAYNVLDMQKFLELYGMPLRLGKYPSGIDTKQRNELLQGLRSLGTDGAGIIPSTMAIDLIEAKSGKSSDFMDVIGYWEKKQSIAILGSTLTSQADGKTSTNALGEIHNAVRQEIMHHDVRQIVPAINRGLVEPIVRLNGMFAPDRMPRFGYDTSESVDQKMLVEVLEKAAAMGLEIDVGWAHDALQIPRAGTGSKLLTTPGRVRQADQSALARLAALAQAADEADATPAFAQRLAQLSVPHEQAMVDQVYAILADAGSYDEAVEKIQALKLNPGGAWADDITQGLVTAVLSGRADILDGK